MTSMNKGKEARVSDFDFVGSCVSSKKQEKHINSGDGMSFLLLEFYPNVRIRNHKILKQQGSKINLSLQE